MFSTGFLRLGANTLLQSGGRCLIAFQMEELMTAYYLDLRANGFPVDQAIRVVRHEVGHWIIGQYHGFKGGDLEITMVSANNY